MSRVSDERLAELIAPVEEMPEVRPDFWALERQLALDLRDCRAALKAAEERAQQCQQNFDAVQEMAKYSTPSDPTGVRNGMRFKALEEKLATAERERDEARELAKKLQAKAVQWAHRAGRLAGE